MSLANFSLPFQVATPSTSYLFTTNINNNDDNNNHGPINNLQLNGVLPSSTGFSEERQYHNQPYIPPAAYQRQHHHHQLQQQEQQQQRRSQDYFNKQIQSQQPQQYTSQRAQQRPEYISTQNNRYNDYGNDFRRTQPRQHHTKNPTQQQMRPPPLLEVNKDESRSGTNQNTPELNRPPDPFPGQPDGYTRVNGGSYGSPGTKTSVHAVLDYDDDDDIDDETSIENDNDYYDENIPRDARVTPIQGPIYLKNGSVPVVPLYSYPQYNNGSFVQIPILWTALSVALGVELRGDLVRGTPCIKKYHQLFCPTAGKTYPIERIELFIDENKALMKRMYGDFEMDDEYGPMTSSSPRRRKKRSSNKDHDLPDGGPSLMEKELFDPEFIKDGDSFFDKIRNPRQSLRPTNHSETGRVDVCESKVEIVTPYWASNSAAKIRAIVNTQHFEQAIHQEVCSKTQTNGCTGECGCEQKYKWHRLLAYDPDDDCKGIFMDWFLFPSCCVCRCDPHAKFPSPKKPANHHTS
ncbi:hypothetical protein PV328_008977 [Microctonus aethiopoides]|uniref:Spaetzle domain-containing protein n=1 Tax=Microctonus aethiopoides TaxID=144406 RepID=A0AA39FKQ9_9HYME|nr:hypothetical protein PV328_008977 [Microctonus aethiopoides]